MNKAPATRLRGKVRSTALNTVPIEATTKRGLMWIPKVSFYNRHIGLAGIAKKELGIDVHALRPGQYVMFINSAWTQVALYGAGNRLMHYRDPDNRRLNPKVVLDDFLGADGVDYTRSLDRALRDEFLERYPRLGQAYLNVKHKRLTASPS